MAEAQPAIHDAVRPMDNTQYQILIWLPSPIGDAVLSTPALRALRRHFEDAQITFLAEPAVREMLTPCTFNDAWLEQKTKNPITIARALARWHFTHAFLLKNSFASALAVCLARIPTRIGYGREARSFMLTAKLYPPKLSRTRFRPYSMVDYYLMLAMLWRVNTKYIDGDMISSLKGNRTLELEVAQPDTLSLQSKLPQLINRTGPLVIMVPGGAFGPSKYWPAQNFARTADWLVSNYNATVVLSVAANTAEQRIAAAICSLSRHELINLAESPVTLGELKALFSKADLVISNDTGPRHIAVALGRKVITMFGPNDPAWTDSGYRREIQLIGRAPCAPCARPRCKESEHLCMEAITVEMVCDAAEELLNQSQDDPAKQ